MGQETSNKSWVKSTLVCLLSLASVVQAEAPVSASDPLANVMSTRSPSSAQGKQSTQTTHSLAQSKRSSLSRRQGIIKAMQSLTSTTAVAFVSANLDGPSYGAFIKLNFTTNYPSVLGPSGKFIDPTAPFPCSYIVNVNSPNLLGQDCLARVSYQQQVIKLMPGKSVLGNANAVTLGSQINILNGTIFRLNNYNSPSTQGYVVVGRESFPQAKIDFQGPPLIDTCSDLSFSTSQLGTGGRQWASVSSAVTYSATPSGNTAFEALVGTIAAQLQNGNATKFRIPAANVPPATNFTLAFTFTSTFGDSVVRSFAFAKIAAQGIPVVVFDTPSSLVDFTKDFRVSAQVAPSACATPAGKATFQWSSSNYTISSNANAPMLLIPKGSLLPSTTYNFAVNVGFPGQGSYVFTTSFTTLAEKLVIDISAPGVAGTLDNIQLNPVIRSNNPGFVLANAVCAWTLFDVTNNIAAVSARAGDSGAALPITTGSCIPVVIYSGQVGTGQFIYTMTVTYNSIVYTTKSTYFTIATGSFIPLMIAIDQSQSARLAALTLAGFTSVTYPLTYTWTSETSCSDNNVYTVAPITAASTVTALNTNKLKFAAGVLATGTSYCFKLTVQNLAQTSIGYAFYPITTGAGPVGGSCAAYSSLSIGAFVDYLSLTCSGWTTDAQSYPLVYRYDFYTVGAASTTFQTLQAGSSPSLTAQLPPGTFQIKVSIIDSFDNIYEYPTQFTVVSTQGTFAKRDLLPYLTILVTNYTTGAYSNFNSTSNVASALTVLATLNPLLTPFSSQTNMAAVRTLVLAFLNAVSAQANALDAVVTIPTISSIIANMVGSTMDKTTCETIFTIMTRMSAVAAVAPICYQTTTVSDIGTIFGSILSSLGASSTYSSAITATFASTIESFDRCSLTNLVCGQTAISQSTTGYNHSIAIQDPGVSGNTINTLFSNSTVALSYTGSCVRLTTSTYINNGVNNAAYSKYIDMSPVSTIYGVYNATSNAVITPVFGATTVSIVLNVPSSLIATDSLQTYHIKKRATQNYPVCAYVSNNAYTSTGCVNVGFSGNTLTCACSQLGEYAVLVTAQSSAPTASAVVYTTSTASSAATATTASVPTTATGTGTGTGTGGTSGAKDLSIGSAFAVIAMCLLTIQF